MLLDLVYVERVMPSAFRRLLAQHTETARVQSCSQLSLVHWKIKRQYNGTANITVVDQ